MEFLFLIALERLQCHEAPSRRTEKPKSKDKSKVKCTGLGNTLTTFFLLIQTGWLCVDGSIKKEKHQSIFRQRLSAYTFPLMYATTFYFAISVKADIISLCFDFLIGRMVLLPKGFLLIHF